ncbi:uncharacterized protein LOC143996532 [Lithobates pipiens]
MPSCFVQHCSHVSGKQVTSDNTTLFRFPKDCDQIKIWLEKAGMEHYMIERFTTLIMEDKKGDSFRICSQHFSEDCFQMEGNRRKLKTGSIPTIFQEMPTTSKHTTKKWENRLSKLARKEFMSTIHNTTYSGSKRQCKCDCPEKNVLKIDVGTQTGMFDFPSFESEESYIKIADERCIHLDHSYCEHDFMRPLEASTPDFKSKSENRRSSAIDQISDTGEVDPLIILSPTVCDLPSEDINIESTLDDLEIESPIIKKKRKLAYEDDPSCHESDFDTPQKSDFTLNDSIIEPLTVDPINDPLNMINENKFIVFESSLDTLLFKMRCPDQTCFSKITKIEKKIVGTMLIVFSTCNAQHRIKLWESQPKIKNYAAGNIVLAGAICLSGGSYQKVKEMFDLSGISMFGKSSYNRAKKQYIYPSIDYSWNQNCLNVKEELTGTPLFLIGDGQCDSPGFCAKYTTYTFMDIYSKKIVDFELVQVSQTTSSVAMEKLGFTIALDRILENEYDVQFVGTDRHTGIRKLLTTTKYENINHQFDIWHYVKNLKRKLIQISKKKAFRPILPWIGAILTHFYWCSRTCDGNEDVFRQQWQSLLHHVVNEHSWRDGDIQHQCLHDDQSILFPKIPWLEKNTPAFDSLSAIIMDAQIEKDLKHLTYFCQTGTIETYHSMMLKYRPKRIHYKYDSMEARTRLAALQHNNNIGRKMATVTKIDDSGEVFQVERKNLEFPRGRKKWIVRNVFEKMSNEHAKTILANMLSITEGTLKSTWKSKNVQFPKNIATEERPETSAAIAKHRTRFPVV